MFQVKGVLIVMLLLVGGYASDSLANDWVMLPFALMALLLALTHKEESKA